METCKIVERYGIAEAKNAVGQVIVIDVIRAFTTAAYAFHQGAAKIILVSTAEEAFGIREKDRAVVLVGEDGGKMIAGFDYGNSPEAISKLDLKNKTIVLRSSSGTQGVVHATKADQVYLGSLVVASATVRHLQTKAAKLVTILAMGSVNGPDKEEDLACQKYMGSVFAGSPLHHQLIKDEVIQSPAGQQALNPEIDWKTPGDLECAIAIDRFNFVMPVVLENGLLVARRVQG